MPQPHLLSDSEFAALLPHILPASPRGRQIGELRARLDAIFAIGNSAALRRALEPSPAGKPETIARHFRRLDLTKALPAPPWLLPDPNMSETLRRIVPASPNLRKPLARLLRAAAGRRRIPRIRRLPW
jgi:hypothetical protein